MYFLVEIYSKIDAEKNALRLNLFFYCVFIFLLGFTLNPFSCEAMRFALDVEFHLIRTKPLSKLNELITW